jgi:hypothetical protein
MQQIGDVSDAQLVTAVARYRVTIRGKSVWNDAAGEWTIYFDLDANQPIDVILDEIGADPTCVFWG